MCGVIGYTPLVSGYEGERRRFFRRLLEESQIRGVHAMGIAQHDSRGMLSWMKSHESDQLDVVAHSFDPYFPAIAHCRYSTSGDWQDDRNNQPIIAANRALAFNGVIHMGTKEEFEKEYDVSCLSENDGEIFLRKLERGWSASDFVSQMTGSFAGCWLEDGRLKAIRNTRRPLWKIECFEAIWFASTQNIFHRIESYKSNGTAPVELIPLQEYAV